MLEGGTIIHLILVISDLELSHAVVLTPEHAFFIGQFAPFIVIILRESYLYLETLLNCSLKLEVDLSKALLTIDDIVTHCW